MATKRQIAANRRNARHSTGPKTLQGKAASMNALRHGLRARTMVVPGEHQEDFDQIHAGLQGLYQPENPAEQYWFRPGRHRPVETGARRSFRSQVLCR